MLSLKLFARSHSLMRSLKLFARSHSILLSHAPSRSLRISPDRSRYPHSIKLPKVDKSCGDSSETAYEFLGIMDRLEGSPKLMLVTDLDSTLVDHEDQGNIHLLRFNALWEAYFRRDSLLVFSTGRTPVSYRSLRKRRPLLTPDITVTSVGSEIMYGGESMVLDSAWEARLDHSWDRDIVVEETSKFPDLTPQPERNQRPYKVSFFVGSEKAMEIMKILPEQLGKRGVDVKLIYSNDFALDVLPKEAGKGGALSYLLENFKINGRQPLQTLVCGDSGNDAELFAIAQVYGVMVGNSHKELLQWHEENAGSNPSIIHATERCAAGIIEAIQGFGLGQTISPRDICDTMELRTGTFNPTLEMVQFYLFYERWRRGEVEKSGEYFQNLKSLFNPLGTFVHPSGAERLLHECIDEMESLYGDKKEKQYCIWLDRVLSSQISSDSWLASFTKCELSEGKIRSCLTKVLLSNVIHSEDYSKYLLELKFNNGLETPKDYVVGSGPGGPSTQHAR